MKYEANSDMDRLIERAFEHDKARLPEPPSVPPASLLQKFAASARAPIAHPLGFFSSVAGKWLLGLVLGSAAAGAIYFAGSSQKISSGLNAQPPQHSQVVAISDSARPAIGAVRDTEPSASPSLAFSKSHSKLFTRRLAASPRISEDSILREEVAHPTIIPAPDSARTTIHAPGRR